MNREVSEGGSCQCSSQNQNRASVLPIIRRLGQKLSKSICRNVKRAKHSSPTLSVNPILTCTCVGIGIERANVAGSPPSRTLCKLCGTHIMGRQKFCSACAPTNSKEALVEAARKGRIAAQTPQALSRLAETQRSHRLAERAWKPEDKPDWLDDKAYAQEIHPRLADMTISTIALTLRVSLPYASDNLPTRAGVWGFQEAPQPESVVCKCLTSENSHVPTWGSTLFAALSLQKTTTALKRPHTRACGTSRRTAESWTAIALGS